MSKKKWYVTVGVPGGEYAVKAEGFKEARLAFCKADEFELADKKLAYIPTWHVAEVRPAPPELVEWLETPPCEYIDTHYGLGRMRVDGGWLICAHTTYVDSEENLRIESDNHTMIPVALASGITVIEGESYARFQISVLGA